MYKELIIYFCGLHSLFFAIFHLLFWKIFKWEKDLKKSSAPTREIIQILNLRLIYIFLFYAFLCFFFTRELLTTTLGQTTLVGLSLFWTGRTIEQFVFWKYNPLNINLVLTCMFILGAVLFAFPITY
jgi:hypothetical protein